MAASLLRLRTSVIRNYLPINSTFSRLPFSTASTSPLKRVGTHNGTFHCDEALGCFMIRLTSKFHGAQIIRTRNLQVLDTLDAVLDVGGVYDPSRNRFDHHHKGFNEILGGGFATKLSGAGLVYKHYGVEIIAKTVQLDEGHPDVHRLFLAVYKNFIEEVDAIDNGINQYETDQPPRYVNNTTLSSRIPRLNVNWYDDDQSPEKEDQAFQHAMALAGNEFMDSIHFHAKSWLPARLVVMECLAARKNIDSGGEIMLLTRSCPMEMEVKALLVVLIQKLRDKLNEESVANNKSMTCQLKRLLQSLSEENDEFLKSRDCLFLLYEVEDEIDKFSFQVARQRKWFGFLMNQPLFFNNLNSCRVLIRKLKNFTSKIYCLPENHKAAATPSSSIPSASAVWPIPTIPSAKHGPLTRSVSTISHLHPQKKKLTFSYSYNNDNVLSNVHDHQWSYEVAAKRYNDLCINLKPCLLYLVLFPKDYDIPVRRLLRLWQAEELVERKPSPDDFVQKHFKDLVDRGMIQITKLRSDNSPKQCRLVPIFHGYLSAKALGLGMFYIHHGLEHLEDVAGPFGVRRMIQQMGSATGALTNSDRARNFNPSLLRSYVSFNRPRKDMPAKEVGLLLGGIINSDFRLLKVLDLEGVNKPTLPNKLDHLYLLKYLGLRGTNMDYLPESVGKLSYLETLDLKRTNIDSLPNSIWQLKQLRHLNLNGIRFTMPPSSSLTLVTLWGLVLDDNISVNEVLGMLLNLRELGIKFQLSTRSQGVLLDWIGKLANLQSLRLTSANGLGQALKLVLKPLATLVKLSHLNLLGNLERLPSANEFPPTVKVLTLSISQLSKDPMETLGQLPCLIVLRLLGDSFTGKRMVCLRGGFKKLEVLKMWKLAELEEWDVEEEAMESLKELNIRHCDKLKNIPCRLLIKPRRMERLILTNMPGAFVDRIKKSTTLTVTTNH
ncbi:hypothetical protein L1987_62559 [Smallanthus sonchifolius]|uniref:Uncharacterized protein n=1 Tax=Smallanthus sonchifolius TaxID=185202 RepID=A0ACB9CAP7_9ASTR|nr:hypothetical protein L1987_62559 [Smallanthus sonchifolius]